MPRQSNWAGWSSGITFESVLFVEHGNLYAEDVTPERIDLAKCNRNWRQLPRVRGFPGLSMLKFRQVSSVLSALLLTVCHGRRGEPKSRSVSPSVWGGGKNVQ